MTTSSDYLDNQIDVFTENKGHILGLLLEQCLLQITFLRVTRHDKLSVSEEVQEMLVNHVNKTLQLSAALGQVSQTQVDEVIAKAANLIDCADAIVDPTRTNLH